MRVEACQFVFSCFIYLETMFAILKFPPTTCSNGQQDNQFKQTDWHYRRGEHN